VLVAEARAAGRDWVIAHAAVTPGFRGAFFSGSVASRPETAEQPRWSDVDVMVVLATDPVPPKPGKIRHRGALLDVTYLPWSLVTDIDVVARSYHLAPCFTGDHVILDPTGHLRLLRDTIAPSFADAVAVERRYEDVITALEARLAVLDPAAAWHDQRPPRGGVRRGRRGVPHPVLLLQRHHGCGQDDRHRRESAPRR
jgi:hypothetical protein